LSLVLQLRAVALLETGRPDKAFEEVQLALRLADSIRTEPILISHLVRIACLNLALQAIKEGLARRLWSEEQLVHFQQRLAGLDLLAEHQHCLRAERAFALSAIDYYRSSRWKDLEGGCVPGETLDRVFGRVVAWGPSGWYEQNKLTLCRWHERWTFPLIDSAARQVNPEAMQGFDETFDQKATPYDYLARLLFPAVSRIALRSARGQTAADQAMVACALERCRRAQGEFPTTLDGLLPRFLDKLPKDIMDAQSLRYRRTSDDQFILYSIGWNGKDDEGAIIRAKSPRGSVDAQQGDWVWAYPSK
jgi:hypothetical protein